MPRILTMFRFVLTLSAAGVLITAPLALHAADAETIYPAEEWARSTPAEVGMDEAKLRQAREYALSGGGSGYVTRHGRLVMSWGDPAQRYDLKSSTKSIGVTTVGLAIKDGKLKLDDKATARHPKFGTPPAENEKTGWLDDVTLLHLATQTAGFAKPGGYQKLLFEPGTKWSYSDGGPNWLAECVTLAYRRDLNDLMFERVFTPLGIEPNDLRWRNNSYRPKEIEGIPRREFGSGISANVDAMARIGYLYLRGGKWRDEQIIPREFVDRCRTTLKQVVGIPEQDGDQHGNASDHYGLLWWNNADGTLKGVPRDAYWSWGLYDSLIVVVPSRDVVVSRAGKSWKRNWSGHYDVLGPFLTPIAESVEDEESADSGQESEVSRTLGVSGTLIAQESGARSREAVVTIQLAENRGTREEEGTERSRGKGTKGQRWKGPKGQSEDRPLHLFFFASLNLCNSPPYPPSPIIRRVDWAAAETIVRRARGSDNWPLTWGDDDRLYAAYGDGRGFQPFTEKKLSLGLAAITGRPPDFTGKNIRSPSAEQTGGGASGKKASGMLMVDGVLYMWVRNAENSQLARSEDRGKSWTWADWRFTTSFGCPTFLNFGRDYAGARDEFVYVYSHDSDSAYEPADRMVMARVPKTRIMDRASYEFFEKLDRGGEPVFTKEIERRGAVFTHQGRCYRNGISYNAPLKRYLWCQTIPGGDTRFRGGLGIYDAPQPWGPWTTVFFTENWDVGPGESSSIPPKWIGGDGRTFHLVFSGDDCFSVRAGTFVTE